MKKTIKLLIALLAVLVALIVMPNVSKAATTEVNDEESLRNAITNAQNGDTINLSTSIKVSGPIVVEKELTINGQGHTVTGSDDWTSTSGNQTMFTAQLAGAKLTLENVKLQNGPKYGVQSYNGGYVKLNNVTISDFNYGGVLVNAGTLYVQNLNLGQNGATYNGIEIDRGVYVTSEPTIIMNGTLNSSSKENVVYVAENAGTVKIENEPVSTNKIVVSGDKLFVTNNSNSILSSSTIPGSATVSAGAEKVVLTVVYDGKAKDILVDLGKTTTADAVKASLGLSNVEGFYIDRDFSNEFDFSKAITANTTLYAKAAETPVAEEQEDTNTTENVVATEENEGEKDETPKTGVANYVGIAALVIVVSAATIYFIRKNRI